MDPQERSLTSSYKSLGNGYGSLTTTVIPESVKEICDRAFRGYNNLVIQAPGGSYPRMNTHFDKQQSLNQPLIK